MLITHMKAKMYAYHLPILVVQIQLIKCILVTYDLFVFL